MKKVLIASVVLALLSLPVFSQPVDKLISVDGHGEVNVEPNVAYVRFGVEVIENEAVKAQTVNAERMTKLIQAMNDIGIERDNIETENYNLTPLTKYGPDKKIQIIGYRCDNQVTVTIDNMDTVGNVIDKGISAGADRVDSLTFSIKDEQKYKYIALEKAVEDAKGKARTIENAAKVQIKRIYNISEKGAAVMPVGFGRFAVAAMESALATPIISGKVKVTADVQMHFEF